MLVQGEGAGNIFDETNDETPGQYITCIVHRAALLRELLANVPQERMHASKKLDKFDWDSDGSVMLHFAHDCLK